MNRIRIIFAILLILGIISVIVIFVMNYTMLNILSGYAAKNLASSVYIGKRSVEFTLENDNNFSPVNLASVSVDMEAKTATGTAFGLMKRTAVYREGLGCTLVSDDFDINAPYQKPQRTQVKTNSPYPYGDLPQRDTTFTNVDYDALNKAINAAFENPEVQKTRSVLVIYKDQIIGEKYAEGYDVNSSFLGWSMTKSILATCFGILQYEGKLDINAPAPIEAWHNDDRDLITINHLLHMNSGLAWDEDYATMSDVTKMLFLAKDVTLPQAEKAVLYPPNKHWNYSSGTTNLLSGILRKQFENQQEYLNYPYQVLIDRIGMHSMLLETDMTGNFVASSYSWGTTRDWAKFGLLYLHEGNWNGDQVFDENWVDYVQTPAPNSEGVYGGHFWLNAKGQMPDIPKDYYSANGFQGQHVSVIPSKDLVIVRFGLAESPDFDQNKIFGGIAKAINQTESTWGNKNPVKAEMDSLEVVE